MNAVRGDELISGFEAMKETERIQGNDRFAVFTQLKDDATLVKMRLMDRDYEQLTMVTDVQDKAGGPFFLIDPPSGFKQAVHGLDVWKIHFEFTSSVGVQYEFKTPGGKISEKKIWINFPKFVDKIQRRRDFRLEFPSGTVIRFEEDHIEYELKVINLSMGGTLAEFSLSKTGRQAIPMAKTGDTLRNIDLISPSEEDDSVHIKKALILRLSRNDKADRYRLGLQFTEIEKNEIKALKDLIYHVQRDFLKKRLRTDA